MKMNFLSKTVATLVLDAVALETVQASAAPTIPRDEAKPEGCTLFTILQITITSYLNGQIKYH